MIPNTKWLPARVSTLIQVSSRRDRRKHPLSHLPAGDEDDGKLEQIFPSFSIYYRRAATLSEAVMNVKCQGFTYPPCLQHYGPLEPDCVLTRRWSLDSLNIYSDTLTLGKLLLSKMLKLEILNGFLKTGFYTLKGCMGFLKVWCQN